MATKSTAVLPSALPSRYRVSKWMYRAGLHFTALVLSVACLLPFVISISASLTEEKTLAKYGYTLFPAKYSDVAYRLLFKAPEDILRSYGVTFFVAVVGTLLSLVVMVPFSYALSRRDYHLRKVLSFFVFFTMVFSGGMVPFYILVKQYLQLGNTIWVMILPFLVNGFTIIILRSNFATMPQEILDAARIDGAGEWLILLQIATPMTTPVIAALSTFMALGFWNTYFPALLFIDDRKLYPLQYLLYILQSNLKILLMNPQYTGIQVPVIGIRYAMVTLIGTPIALFTLFFQRYFVRGIYLGGIKE